MVQADGGRPEFVEGNDVSEDYFSILSIPLRAGRVFNREDARRDRPTAVVVNEAYALAHWGSTDAAVGKQLAFPNPMGHPAAPAEVVGVVGNSREIGAALTWTPRVYTSFRGRFFAERMTVLVKSRAGAAAVAATLSAAVKQLDPEQPFSRVLSLERTVSARYARQRLTLVMMAVFATLTLLLAAVGIHGVVSYAVTLRRREIGIRRAFGATGTSVVRLFVVRATGLILLGLVVGLPAGVALRWIAVVEWVGSAQSDWLTCLGGVGIVAVTGITAALVPAWRATRLDAMDVLRCE